MTDPPNKKAKRTRAKRDDATRDAAWERLRALIVEHISRVGWSVLHVAAGSSEKSTSLCYTIGLTEKGLPELVVLGLDQSSAHWVMNEVAALAVAGEPVTPGRGIVIDAGHFPLRVRSFPNANKRLLAAARYCGGMAARRITARQLVWAVDGAFPGEPGYPHGEHVQALACKSRADAKPKAVAYGCQRQSVPRA
jgi:hypothetical protein